MWRGPSRPDCGFATWMFSRLQRMDAHQPSVSIGVCVRDLEMIAKATDPEDLRNQITHLPL
jgi:hypothetical protein